MSKWTDNKLGWLSAILCLLCLTLLLVFAQPWGVQSVDWSILPEDGQEWQGENGWAVFVIRDGNRVLLTPDGNGGYEGCRPGEAFFLTRTIDAETAAIAGPTLRIHAVSSSVAVWLDNLLVYTDAPLAEELPDTGIALPQLARERRDPVEVALYNVTAGSVLTMAQSTPLAGEKPGSTTVYPCDVEVASLFGYERSLIAPAYDLGLLCAVLCLVGVTLSVLAVRLNDASLLLLALLAFARTAAAITGVSFFSQYTLVYTMDLSTLANLFSVTLMLAFLAVRLGAAHGLGIGIAALHGLAVLAALAAQAHGLTGTVPLFFSQLPTFLTPALLVGAVALCIRKAHIGNEFCQMFLRALTVGAVLCAVWLGLRLGLHPQTLHRLLNGQVELAVFLRTPLIWLTQGTVLATVLLRACRRAVTAQEERVFSSLHTAALQESYENLRSHQNEIMMLRHEMKRHYATLKAQLDGGNTEWAKHYLDDLLAQQAQVPKVVDTDNELINILLNSRLAQAEAHGLQVEIDRLIVPAQLPLSDTDTVSMLLNILDNAIAAAEKAEKKPGVIRLNMNCKNNYFTFLCENSAAVYPASEEKSPYHGYGLHIVERILTPYGKLMTVHREPGLYRIIIALPLPEIPRKQPTVQPAEPYAATLDDTMLEKVSAAGTGPKPDNPTKFKESSD